MASNRRGKGRNKSRFGNASNNGNGSAQEAGQQSSKRQAQDAALPPPHPASAADVQPPLAPQQLMPNSEADTPKPKSVAAPVQAAGPDATKAPVQAMERVQESSGTMQQATANPDEGGSSAAAQQQNDPPAAAANAATAHNTSPGNSEQPQLATTDVTQQQQQQQQPEDHGLNVEAPEFVPAAARASEPAQATEPAATPVAEPPSGCAADHAAIIDLDEERAARLLSMAKVPEPPAEALSPAPSAHLSPEQAAVLGAWHAAYTAPSEAAQDKAIRTKYDPKAVFEDHLVKVHSSAYISAQFFALRQLFPRFQVFVAHVALLEGHEAVAAARQAGALDGSWLSRLLGGVSHAGDDIYVLRIQNRQDMFLPFMNALTGLVLPDHISLWVSSTLVVRASDDVILHHTDDWHNLPKLPWLVRSQVGGWSSWAMHSLLGW